MIRVYCLLALFLTGCGPFVIRPLEATTVQLVDSMVINNITVEGVAGVMRCDGNKPVVFILKALWATPGFELTRKHEMEHVRQAERDCQRFLKRYRDDMSFRFQCELDAYIAEAGAKDSSLVDTITDQLMFPYYNFPYSRDSVRVMVRARFPP